MPLARSDLSKPFVRTLAAENMTESPASRTSALARVTVHGDVAEITHAWADLEANAACSIYQTRAFLFPWIQTLGQRADLVPLFVLARDVDDRPMLLLCLGLEKHGPLTIASWLGGKDLNVAMPLARRGLTWSRADVLSLLRQAVECHGGALDLFVLSNQPHHWCGATNPLAILPHLTSPSAAYGAALQPLAEDFLSEKLSKSARKKLRKKEAWLTAMGPLVHRSAATEFEAERIVDAFLAFKINRFRALGIKSDFEAPAMRDFIIAAHASGGVELHALEVADRIIAVYGGGAHGGRWSGMFNAFDPAEDVARSSPGDLLLMRIVAQACKEGLTGFDLGIGEARYKASLCDETIALFDLIVPITLRGRLAAGFFAARQRVKRVIKQSPRLTLLVKRTRGLRATLGV